MDGDEFTAARVGNNELILTNIFQYLDEQSIKKCLRVCKQWSDLAGSVDRSKRKILQVIAIFLIERFKSSFIEKYFYLNMESPSIQNVDSYSDCRGPEIFEHQFLSALRLSYSEPSCLILLEGSNTKLGKKRRWKRARVINTIRSRLPVDCSVVGIDAHYGIIGESSETALTQSKDPVTISYDVSGLFAISGVVLPKFPGVRITIFERATDDLEEEFNIPDDTKAVILFSSGVSNRGAYLSHVQVDAIFDHFDGQLALGGAQVNDKLVTSQPTVQYFSDDTANFYFINGPPPYNAMFNPAKMSLIGIQFAGPNCEAASLTINRPVGRADSNPGSSIEQDLAHLEETLTSFRSNLPFPCDTQDSSNESLAFLFFNFDYYKYYFNHTMNTNVGVSLFHKVFPKTHITGILCHAQYGHNFVPQSVNRQRTPTGSTATTTKIKSNHPNLLPSNLSIASFVIINLNKRRK